MAERDAPYGERDGDECAEHYGTDQAQGENAFAASGISRRKILAGKSGRGLSECGDHIVTEIFKVHGDRASCGGDGAKAVDGCLDKNVGKAEYCALHCGGDSRAQYADQDTFVDARLLQGDAGKHKKRGRDI